VFFSLLVTFTNKFGWVYEKKPTNKRYVLSTYSSFCIDIKAIERHIQYKEIVPMNKIKFDHVRTQLIAFLWKIINDWSFSLGSLVAYYLVLSLLPLLLAVFSISLMLFGGNVELQQIIRDRLVKAFPEQSLTELVDALQKSMKDQAWAIFIISLIVAIFGGSRLIIGIDDSLTIIYRIRERTILQQNIHAIKMLLIFIIFLPLIIVSSSVTAVLKEKEVFYYFLSTLSSGLFTFILFNLIYYYVPAREMKFRNTYVEHNFKIQ
jgi:uncharacterized BrkB/YihY/UPF0761 family membrane protein